MRSVNVSVCDLKPDSSDFSQKLELVDENPEQSLDPKALNTSVLDLKTLNASEEFQVAERYV